MVKERPLLLLSNDDGFNAKGICELVKVLRPIADLVVVAPDGPRSGSSGAITSIQSLQCSLVQQEPGLSVYKCTGTPVDCIKLALFDIVTRVPDMIIGGINHGDNSSVNVHYSGTMGVVIEGCLKGFPSVGFSLCNHAADADFSPVLPFIRSIVETVLKKGLPAGTCLNVNFPDTDPIKGVRICRQTNGVWINEFIKKENQEGESNYQLTGDYCNFELGVEDTDRWALDNGYVAVTPIQVDMTAYSLMEEMKSWNL